MSALFDLPGLSLVGYVIPFLIVLGAVIFFHEYGHYLAARWLGIRVEDFSIGFGKEIWSRFDRRGTKWRIAVIPLGGFVRFFGDADAASIGSRDDSEMSEEEKAVSFHHQPLWRRAIIVAAGPLANFLLAIAIFSGLLMVNGRTVTDPVVSSLAEGGAAQLAGIREGDMMLSISGKEVRNFSDVQKIVLSSRGKELLFVVERQGEELSIPVTPQMVEMLDDFGERSEAFRVGIHNDPDGANSRTERLNPLEAVWEGTRETGFILGHSLDIVRNIFSGIQSADQVGGPVRIAKASGDMARQGFSSLLFLTAALSASIGLVNLFPIPVLDGGHLVFYAAEALRGKPLGKTAQELCTAIGLGLIVVLMVVVTWNDLARLFTS